MTARGRTTAASRVAATAASGGGVSLLAAGLLAAGLLTPPPLEAQARGPVDQLAVDVRPWSTVVAVTASIPAGSRHDPAEAAGTAWVVGHAVAHRLAGELGSSATAVEVKVGRSRTVFSVLALPDEWEAAYRALSRALFREPLEEVHTARARSDLVEQLLFESGAPMLDFHDLVHQTLTSSRHPWARPPAGYPEQVSGLELEDLEEYREGHYRPHTAVVAVVGPVSPRRVASLVPARIRISPEEGAVEKEIWGSLSWERGRRVRVVEEVTNTWIGVAFPAPLGAPRTSLEMLARVVREELNPSPPDPGVYSADASVVETPIGPVLLVVAAVFPEVADRWEREMVEAVRSVAARAPDPAAFRWQRRRFRTHVLLREALPEERGRRFAADLHRSGVIRDMTAEIWALDPEDLEAVAAALGEPRIVVFGPELGEGSQR